MAFQRTNETQTEHTATGIITTVREYNSKTKQSRWVQIGYTSLEKRTIDGKEKLVPTGPYGQRLLNNDDPYIVMPD